MSSFTKIAFVQGLQRSLISRGVLPQYSSPLQAKIAAENASDSIKEELDTQEPPEEEVQEALVDLVENVPAEDTVEAIEEIAQKGELEEALAVLQEADQSKQASIAYRFLAKMAAEDASVLVGAPEKQNDGRDPSFANKGGKAIIDKLTASIPQTTVKAINPNATSQGIDFDQIDKTVTAKQAAWLLRKLAGGDASEIGGKGAEPAQHDGKPEGFANNGGDPILQHLDLKAGHGLDAAVPHPNSEAGTPREDKLDVGPDVAALVHKTASEVGHFLPHNLTNRDKVAALRTMSLMNNTERAIYLGRIKQAAEEKAKVDAEQSKDINNLEDDVKNIETALNKQDEEKVAAQMLRRLGIGV